MCSAYGIKLRSVYMHSLLHTPEVRYICIVFSYFHVYFAVFIVVVLCERHGTADRGLLRGRGVDWASGVT